VSESLEINRTRQWIRGVLYFRMQHKVSGLHLHCKPANGASTGVRAHGRALVPEYADLDMGPATESGHKAAIERQVRRSRSASSYYPSKFKP
jgi:hypothetical protein